jgi:hypothetical protein
MKKFSFETLFPKNIQLPKNLTKGFLPNVQVTEVSRYLSGSLLDKALMSLDKATLLIVGVTWLVALAAMGFAFLAVREAAALKVKAETARALEPILPKINRLPLSKDQYTPLMDRLKKEFPMLAYEITPAPTLRIYGNNGEDFISWLNAVSYTDSMISSIRWTMISFCVGSECPGDHLMQAELVAEAINISQPENKAF